MNDSSITIDPMLTMVKAQDLLDQGNLDMAMPYFFEASERFAKIKNWEKAGECRSKAAYCYEIDGRIQEACTDYEMAALFFSKGNFITKANEARLYAISLIIHNLITKLNAARPLVIGVVGSNGSGKDEVVNRLNEVFNIPSVSTGDITRDIAQEEGIEPTRENLHEITQRYWAKYGREFYPSRIAQKIEGNNWKVVGVTGIRPPSDVNFLKEYFGDNFILICVEVTDPRTRYSRLLKRSETRDPKGYEDFLRQDASEEEIFQLRKTISLANITFNNDGPIENLNSEIDKLALALHLESK